MALFYMASHGEDYQPYPHHLPDLPEGVVAILQDPLCGNASCVAEVVVTGPEELTADELKSSLGWESWDCRYNGFLDFREVCVGPARVTEEGEVRFEVAVMSPPW